MFMKFDTLNKHGINFMCIKFQVFSLNTGKTVLEFEILESLNLFLRFQQKCKSFGTSNVIVEKVWVATNDFVECSTMITSMKNQFLGAI